MGLWQALRLAATALFLALAVLWVRAGQAALDEKVVTGECLFAGFLAIAAALLLLGPTHRRVLLFWRLTASTGMVLLGAYLVVLAGAVALTWVWGNAERDYDYSVYVLVALFLFLSGGLLLTDAALVLLCARRRLLVLVSLAILASAAAVLPYDAMWGHLFPGGLANRVFGSLAAVIWALYVLHGQATASPPERRKRAVA